MCWNKLSPEQKREVIHTLRLQLTKQFEKVVYISGLSTSSVEAATSIGAKHSGPALQNQLKEFYAKMKKEAEASIEAYNSAIEVLENI